VCGIVGWAFEQDLVGERKLIDMASCRLIARGPDAGGTWTSADELVAFGHRRLSVLDVTESGAQPMMSRDGRYVITFNGEIYNHLEIRTRLEQEGAVHADGWLGTSDTETILAAISAWGIEATLPTIVGMFAFGLWDNRARALTLARDRFGEKPLYVARIGRGVAFASELKALTWLPRFDAAIDSKALEFFLGHGYIQAPASIYSSVSKLLPGSFVTISEESIRGVPPSGDFLAEFRQFYWRLEDVAIAGLNSPFAGSEIDAVEELNRVLTAAVQRQMISDVPLGAFLSGGIDSSAIVALMQAGNGPAVKTFTIGFEESEYDESGYAEAVAKHLGADHTTVVLSAADALNRIQRLPQIWDEPFADVSQIPTLLLSEVTRRDVTVALSGDGGDELFGGYDRYSWTVGAWTRLHRIPAPVRGALASTTRLLSPSAWDRLFRPLPTNWRRHLTGDRIHKVTSLIPAATPTDLYDKFMTSWKSDEPLLLSSREPPRPHWSGYPALPTIEETLMLRDGVDYLTDDVLVKVDRAAMSVGLETRAPFLDVKVAELAWSLPLSYKRFEGKDKLTLRRLVHRYVPPELVERPKAGFAVPLDTWLRGPMREWAEAHLAEEALVTAGLNAEPIRRAWGGHLRGSENHRYFLWNVLTYQAWRAENIS